MTLLLLTLLFTGRGEAADLTMYWTAPCTSVDSASVTTDSACYSVGVPLTDLALIRHRLVRFKDLADTLVLDVPAQGRECDSMAVTFDIEPGSMGTDVVRAVDYFGNESCQQSYLFAVPAQDILPGLFGEYYDNEDLTGFKFARVDAQINFDWDLGSPDPRIGPDIFSIVWTGYVTPAFTGAYRFYTRIEDGCKLWVGGAWLTSDWGVQPEHESSGVTTLTAGLRYAIRMEYMAHNGYSMARLSWEPPGELKAVVPAEAFTH